MSETDDLSGMTPKQREAWRRAEIRKYKEWEDSPEGIHYNTRIECPVGFDDELVVRVLQKIPRRYRVRAQDFWYFVMSDTAGLTLPIFIPGGSEDRKTTVILLNLSRYRSSKQKMTIIAHEIAHGILGHTNGGGGEAAEKAADDLCEKWGFGRAYKSYKVFKRARDTFRKQNQRNG